MLGRKGPQGEGNWKKKEKGGDGKETGGLPFKNCRLGPPASHYSYPS